VFKTKDVEERTKKNGGKRKTGRINLGEREKVNLNRAHVGEGRGSVDKK